MNNDAELLSRFAERGDEGAFGQLVARHLDLVYSAALRQLNGDAHLAQDVAQTVFMDLARKARSLRREVVLSGWLYRAAGLAAAKVVRGEQRRRAREQEAAAMHDPTPELTSAWVQLGPVLDIAMSELSATDRDAVLLRFFERKNFDAIGATLKVSDDAAQKRVARALEKLRVHLTRRGVTLPASALAAAITGGAVQSAPAGLASSLAAASLAAAPAAAGGGLAATMLELMGTTKLKLGIASTVVVAGLGTFLAIEHRGATKLRADIRSLQAQVRQLSAQNAQLAASAAQPSASALTPDQFRELLQLRGAVGALRQQLRQDTNNSKSQTAAQAVAEPPLLDDPNLPVVTYHANLKTHVPAQQSLLMGGWSTKNGRRTLLLVTPQVVSDDAARPQVHCQSKWVEVPDAVLANLGMAEFKAASTDSALNWLLTEAQSRELIATLEQTPGVNLLAAPRVVTNPGTPAQISSVQLKEINGGNFEIGPKVDLLPRIAADGTGIDLNILARLFSERQPENAE
jgi:RNA polymerase sigma factor (sigma-70 family)